VTGLPHKNPLEQVLANKVDLWREDNAGYEMLMRCVQTCPLLTTIGVDRSGIQKKYLELYFAEFFMARLFRAHHCIVAVYKKNT